MLLKCLAKMRGRMSSKNTSSFSYEKTRSGDFLPVIDFTVYYNNWAFYTSGLVDSGASISIFTPDMAQMLKLTIEKGERIYLGGVGGRIKGYIHKLEFNIAEKRFITPVVFSNEYFASFNLLGRNSVFEQFIITFDEKNKTIIFK